MGLAALPFAISGGVFVKALQTSISLVSYLCDIDSTFNLSDKLFEFKGPVIISDVYLKSYKNMSFKNEAGERIWGERKIDPAYDTDSNNSKRDALEEFRSLNNVFKN